MKILIEKNLEIKMSEMSKKGKRGFK